MKNTDDALLDQLRALSVHKKENFGGIPDDYRELIEGILAHNGPAAFMLASIASAAQHFPEFLESLKKSGLVKVTETDEAIGIAKIDADRTSVAPLIRKNWDFFEPGFMMLYIGMKMGRAMEREESKEFSKIVDPGHEGRAKKTEHKPILLPAASDTELPAITPEKAEQFRREMEAEMKDPKKKNEAN